MHILFKQAVHIEGKDYSRGVHLVHETALKSVYFQRLLKAGLVMDAEAAKVVSAMSLADRQEALKEKILGKSAPQPQAGEEKPGEAGESMEQVPPVSPEAPVVEPKAKKKGSKKIEAQE